MDARLVTLDGATHEATRSSLAALLAAGTPFWLDLEGMDDEQAGLLADTFGFHPLALEDAEHFGERPKLDDYDDYTLLVLYGASAAAHLVEVHCFHAEAYLVTVHHDPCAELGELAARLLRRPGGPTTAVMLLYLVVDALVDSFFPVLESLDDRIDELEDDILRRPTEAQLGELFDLKRGLIALRKVVAPERDLLAGLVAGRYALAGMDPDTERYFRDCYDHLIRVGDLVDSYRDLLSGALDTHLSTVSNRLNVVMKQLTIIATVFLPLGFLTGFFGQNFSFLVDHITGLAAFVGIGIGLPALTVVVLLAVFRRRGWLTIDGTPPQADQARRPWVPRAHRFKVLPDAGPARARHDGAPGSPRATARR